MANSMAVAASASWLKLSVNKPACYHVLSSFRTGKPPAGSPFTFHDLRKLLKFQISAKIALTSANC